MRLPSPTAAKRSGSRRLKRSVAAFAVTLIALATGSCNAERATAPPSAAGLTLAVGIDCLSCNLGISPRFIRTLRNTSDATLTVVFSGCGILPYIETFRGEVVYPAGSGWVCGAAISSVTLGPGEAIVDSETLVSLSPGFYRAFAEVDARLGTVDGPRVQLRSRNLWFRIQG
jgi:hypothetical protein